MIHPWPRLASLVVILAALVACDCCRPCCESLRVSASIPVTPGAALIAREESPVRPELEVGTFACLQDGVAVAWIVRHPTNNNSWGEDWVTSDLYKTPRNAPGRTDVTNVYKWRNSCPLEFVSFLCWIKTNYPDEACASGRTLRHYVHQVSYTSNPILCPPTCSPVCATPGPLLESDGPDLGAGRFECRQGGAVAWVWRNEVADVFAETWLISDSYVTPSSTDYDRSVQYIWKARCANETEAAFRCWVKTNYFGEACAAGKTLHRFVHTVTSAGPVECPAPCDSHCDNER